MRRRKTFHSEMSSEFELDLAPLLAVMVKLVPVLLVSSAFVQLMVIETDLPQAVKAAINDHKDDLKKPRIQLEINSDYAMKLIIDDNGTQQVERIPAAQPGVADLHDLAQKLRKAKHKYPKIFRLELAPDAKIPYKFIVNVMDHARRCPDKDAKFPLYDQNGEPTNFTDYMFPDVVFSNVMEG